MGVGGIRFSPGVARKILLCKADLVYNISVQELPTRRRECNGFDMQQRIMGLFVMETITRGRLFVAKSLSGSIAWCIILLGFSRQLGVE
jgi:hypothetical protein